MIAHVIGSLCIIHDLHNVIRSATVTNAIDHAIERRVLLIDWIVRIHQVSLRWHLNGARLAMPPSASGSDCALTSCFVFGNVFAHNALVTL
jgi:hypothetical protein